jgi:hypothetical protein
MSEHPLRRRYGLELGLGLALAALAAWFVLAPGYLGRSGEPEEERMPPATAAELPTAEPAARDALDSKGAALVPAALAAESGRTGTEHPAEERGTQEPAPSGALVAGLVQDEHGAALESIGVYLVGLSSRLERQERTDAQGRFEFRLEEWPGPCRLTAWGGGHRSEERRLEEPARELVVTLSDAAIFRGHVLFDPDVPLEVLRLGVQGPNGDELPLAPDFVFDGLEPGTYTLVVRSTTRKSTHPNLKKTFARFPDLVLAVGENPVRTFDLRGMIVPVRLQIELPDGEPLSGLVQAYIGEEGLLWRVEAGRLRECLAPDETLALFLEGYRWLRVDPALGEQRLRFEAE